MVRRDGRDRIRFPNGQAVYRDFFKPFSPVEQGFSHADRRDLAAAASARKGFGIKGQVSTVFGYVRGGFGSHMDHVRLLNCSKMPGKITRRFSYLQFRSACRFECRYFACGGRSWLSAVQSCILREISLRSRMFWPSDRALWIFGHFPYTFSVSSDPLDSCAYQPPYHLSAFFLSAASLIDLA